MTFFPKLFCYILRWVIFSKFNWMHNVTRCNNVKYVWLIVIAIAARRHTAPWRLSQLILPQFAGWPCYDLHWNISAHINLARMSVIWYREPCFIQCYSCLQVAKKLQSYKLSQALIHITVNISTKIEHICNGNELLWQILNNTDPQTIKTRGTNKRATLH